METLIFFIILGIVATVISNMSDKFKKKENYANDIDENHQIESKDPLKLKGDEYELFIGKKFEEKGDLVLYHGFLLGYKDSGIDLISIDDKNINLIQCKNWTNKTFTMFYLDEIYSKLLDYKIDFYHIPVKNIQYNLQIEKSLTECKRTIKDVESNLSFYRIRKTLYMPDDKVFNAGVIKNLEILTPNIYKYKNMKIVITGRL